MTLVCLRLAKILSRQLKSWIVIWLKLDSGLKSGKFFPMIRKAKTWFLWNQKFGATQVGPQHQHLAARGEGANLQLFHHQVGCVAVAAMVGRGSERDGHRDSRGADIFSTLRKWKWPFFATRLNSVCWWLIADFVRNSTLLVVSRLEVWIILSESESWFSQFCLVDGFNAS